MGVWNAKRVAMNGNLAAPRRHVAAQNVIPKIYPTSRAKIFIFNKIIYLQQNKLSLANNLSSTKQIIFNKLSLTNNLSSTK